MAKKSLKKEFNLFIKKTDIEKILKNVEAVEDHIASGSDFCTERKKTLIHLQFTLEDASDKLNQPTLEGVEIFQEASDWVDGADLENILEDNND